MNDKAEQGKAFLQANQDKYSFEFNNETLQLILHRKIDGRDIAIPLDMTAIFEQCTPESLVCILVNDLAGSMQAEAYCRNNKTEKFSISLEQHTKLLEDNIFCMYQMLKLDKRIHQILDGAVPF